jgi:peptide/nickel transport system ATP-binding protein
MNNGKPLLSVRGLKTYFFTDAGVARAVDGISFDIPSGKTAALVGESGCGKSVTALSIMRLIPSPPGRIVAGEVLLNGRNILDMPEPEIRSLRGNRISMIFQEPMTSLNPVFRVGNQIAAVLELHRKLGREQALAQTIDLLEQVGIPSPGERVGDYPHQMSGGMRQRVMIAMALACDPVLLIADEPTTALDVTIQAQILELLRTLQQQRNMSMLLITHDLGVVAETADEVAVMYAGKIVEQAPVAELFARPQHPYTVGLFKSLPQIHKGGERLHVIAGRVPAATEFPGGCRFHPRCPYRMEVCIGNEPPLDSVGPGHAAACWLHNHEEMARQGRPTGLPDKETAS